MFSYLLTAGGPPAEDICTKQRGGELRFFHAGDVKSGTLARYIEENISGEARVICADKLHFRPGPVKESGLANLEHITVNHPAHIYVDGDITTNGKSAFYLLKRGIIGSWHKVSAKHLSAYLDENAFRLNNRKNPYLFRETLIKLLSAPVLEYRELTATS